MTRSKFSSSMPSFSAQLLSWVFVYFLTGGNVFSTPVEAISRLQIVSPLQALTIWDPEVLALHRNETSWRSAFLPKYKVGLEAETAVRKEYEQKRKELQAKISAAAADGSSSVNWAERAQAAERRLIRAEEKAAEKAFDQATKAFETKRKQERQKSAARLPKNPNKYQFVGIVQPNSPSSAIMSSSQSSPITWYARKKPGNAKWTIRLVHVNRQALIKDLFQSGKVDLFAKYTNTGKVDEHTGLPVITGDYKVRERSWRNLWNFSPKHFITDSSGMYWRERRVRPGLYTDGKTVYEATYRYSDGRNGMLPKSSLDILLKSSVIPQRNKNRILKRLQGQDSPDLVVEEY